MDSLHEPVADGSSVADAEDVVEIDRSTFLDRARYVCPNGHTDWDRTNSHIWCASCARASGGADVDPEHYEIYDKKNDETIAWSRVRLVE